MIDFEEAKAKNIVIASGRGSLRPTTAPNSDEVFIEIQRWWPVGTVNAKNISIRTWGKEWNACWESDDGDCYDGDGATPLDALAELYIKLAEEK